MLNIRCVIFLRHQKILFSVIRYLTLRTHKNGHTHTYTLTYTVTHTHTHTSQLCVKDALPAPSRKYYEIEMNITLFQEAYSCLTLKYTKH